MTRRRVGRSRDDASKVATMRDAIADLVRDGDTVAIEGFTHLISFAAGHEIIRQRQRDLTLARLTPDLVYDQMIAAGVARKLIFSWLGNPGVGGLGAIRRRIEGEIPERAARGRGVQPLRDGRALHGGRDEPAVLPAARRTSRRTCRRPTRSSARSSRPTATGWSTPCRRSARTSRSSTPSARRPRGDTQVWGLLGCQKEAAFAADRVIVVVEEVVDEAVIRADPNRTIIPGLIVDAVVVEPWGAHPSYVQGAYDRDNRFYLDWDPITPRRGGHPGLAARVGLRPRRPGGLHREARRGADGGADARSRAVRLGGLRGVPLTTTSTPDDPRAGPYRSGTGGDHDLVRANLERRRRSHWSSTAAATCRSWGVVRAAAHRGSRAGGSRRRRTRSCHPIAERVLERCDACLRIGGPSEGADRLVAIASGSASPSTRHRGDPVTSRSSDRPTFSKSEMMIVAAARELAGQQVCFVGVGLPNIAVNLAKRTVAPGPGARLRGRRLRGAAGAPAAEHRRPDDRHRCDGGGEHARAVRLLPPGRADRRRVPRRGPDRPVRQHQHDRHRRRTTHPKTRLPGLRRRVRDRDQRPRGLRDHAPEHALVRRDDRLPDEPRQPRRRRAGRADPARGRLAGPGPTVVVTDLGIYHFDETGEMRLDSLHPGATVEAVRDDDRLGRQGRDDLATTPPPTAEELRLIREELDPGGVYTK